MNYYSEQKNFCKRYIRQGEEYPKDMGNSLDSCDTDTCVLV